MASGFVMAMSCCRRLSIFVSLLMFTGSLSLVVVSLLTEYWFESSPISEKDGPNKFNFVHSGLFSGARQLDWGLGPRYKTFTVYEEVHENYGFVSRVPWVFTIFFIALGLLWNIIGVIISIVNTVVKEKDTAAGLIGIYFWSVLALLSYGAAMVIFLILYATSIKQNVLLKDQIEGGFSSINQTRLSFSFYLVVAAMVLLLVPSALMFITAERRPSRNNQKHFSIDNTAFMY